MPVLVDENGYPLPPKTTEAACDDLDQAIADLHDAGEEEAAAPLEDLLAEYDAAEVDPTDPPVNVDIPSVQPQSGAHPGDVLTCTMGNWEGEPDAYAYQWHTMELPPGNLTGDGDEYTVQEGDVGKSIMCVVIATNAAGSTTAPPSNPVMVTGASE